MTAEIEKNLLDLLKTAKINSPADDLTAMADRHQQLLAYLQPLLDFDGQELQPLVNLASWPGQTREGLAAPQNPNPLTTAPKTQGPYFAVPKVL